MDSARGERTLTHLDLFSGVGGFSLGFEAAGFDTVAFSEFDDFPSRVLAKNWPHVPNLGDVRDVDGRDYKHVDVITFGSPCQDFSVAGKQYGIKGERSGLFHEAIRVIREAEPRFAVWENVPGVFTSGKRWDFAGVLDSLAESGALDIAWSVLDAQWFGVPQRRKRIFLVADFAGECAGDILAIQEGVYRDTEPSREEAQDPATYDSECPSKAIAVDVRNLREQKHELSGTLQAKNTGGYSLNYTNPVVAVSENQRAEVRTSETHPALSTGGGKPGQGYPAVMALHITQDPIAGEVAPAMGTGNSRGCATIGAVVNRYIRRLTPVECERLMGWPDGHTYIEGSGDSPRYRACGNGVAFGPVKYIAERMKQCLMG